jgi:hypothetical protein
MEGIGGAVQSECGARIYSQKYSLRGFYLVNVLGPSLLRNRVQAHELQAAALPRRRCRLIFPGMQIREEGKTRGGGGGGVE